MELQMLLTNKKNLLFNVALGLKIINATAPRNAMIEPSIFDFSFGTL